MKSNGYSPALFRSNHSKTSDECHACQAKHCVASQHSVFGSEIKTRPLKRNCLVGQAHPFPFSRSISHKSNMRVPHPLRVRQRWARGGYGHETAGGQNFGRDVTCYVSVYRQAKALQARPLPMLFPRWRLGRYPVPCKPRAGLSGAPG